MKRIINHFKKIKVIITSFVKYISFLFISNELGETNILTIK
jgi:hypothetical protein